MAVLCILELLIQSNWRMQRRFRQIYSCFASLTQGNRTCSLFSFLMFCELLNFLISFFFHGSDMHLFPPSAYPSCWLVQIQQVWGCLGLRLIVRERILKACFPPLCLQLLIFQSDWSHNCLNKDGHYLPSVFATGNEANCPQGRKWLPICDDIDDDFEKGWKRGNSYSLLRGSPWHPSYWECE